MAVVTRTRSMSKSVRAYLSRLASLRLKQASAGEIAHPEKVAEDGKFLVEAGNTIIQAAELAKAKPVVKTVSAEEQLKSENEQLKRQLASLQTTVEGTTIKKRGRRKKIA